MKTEHGPKVTYEIQISQQKNYVMHIFVGKLVTITLSSGHRHAHSLSTTSDKMPTVFCLASNFRLDAHSILVGSELQTRCPQSSGRKRTSDKIPTDIWLATNVRQNAHSLWLATNFRPTFHDLWPWSRI